MPTGIGRGKSAQDAIQKVDELLHAGYTDVVDADLSKYLDTTAPAADRLL
jgi:hypothetical protein